MDERKVGKQPVPSSSEFETKKAMASEEGNAEWIEQLLERFRVPPLGVVLRRGDYEDRAFEHSSSISVQKGDISTD